MEKGICSPYTLFKIVMERFGMEVEQEEGR